MSETISSWSFSKLGDFESCRLKAKLKHLDNIPEPERPLPPGKTEHANDRGTSPANWNSPTTVAPGYTRSARTMSTAPLTSWYSRS